jgi:IstB-like ATP binding protein
LGLATCQKGSSVGFITAAAMVHELIEARDEKRLLRLQRQLAAYKLLIIDELGYVPLSTTGAELLFEVFSQRYERGSTIVTSNLPFDEWTGVFGSERLTGALLDRLTHHAHILEMATAIASSRAGSDSVGRNPTRGQPATVPRSGRESRLINRTGKRCFCGAARRHGDAFLLRPADASSLRR